MIAVSQATATDLHRFYGTPAAKMTVVHEAGPVAVDVTAPEVVAVRARYDLARPYALFVGTQQPRKNILRLAQAYAAL